MQAYFCCCVFVLISLLKINSGLEYTAPGTDFKVSLPKNVKIPTNIAQIEKMDSIDPDLVKNIKFGSDRKYEKNGELSCIHFGKEMLAKGLPAFNVCMKEMQLTIGKLKKKLREVLPCLVKCIGIKTEILLPDGTFNMGYVKKLFDETVPTRFREFVYQIWDTCMVYVERLQPGDENCKTYKPLIKCAIDTAFQVAAEAMKLCTDIPDVFKNTAKSFIKSKKQREILDATVGDYHKV